ncbi:MAG TPA: histidine kinase [Rectinemataceae bacterium]|nr:histidine kinase [Rectinemataceae bacterium]
MRVSIRQGSYFSHLLSAFFIGGFVPFLLLAVVFISMAKGILEKTYRDRAKDAVVISSSILQTLLSDTAAMALEMASAPAIVTYAESPKRTSANISDVHRLLSSLVGSRALSPYVIPIDGSALLSRHEVPDEYRLPNHGGWGILGELSRSENKTPFVFFAQPHPLSEMNVPLAIGTLIQGKDGIAGYLVIDIDRKLIEEKIGQTAKSGGALTELVITDRSGCILYDMSDSRREASFYNPDSAPRNSFFVSSSPVTEGIAIYGMFPIKTVHDYARKIIAVASVVISISALLFLGMAVILANLMARPIHLLTLTMKDVSLGRLDVSCPEVAGKGYNDEMAILIRQFNQMISRVNELVENKVEQERNLRFAELKALQAQMNPHFLYNTLNSIRSVAKLKGDEELAFITTNLASILREGSSSGSDFCSLGHSLELARDYFAIEAWRWPGRFELEENIDSEILNARIPRLIVQPLVENALSHGLESRQGKGTLTIEGRREKDDLVIAISDNGAGIDSEQFAAINRNLARIEEGAAELSVNLASSSPYGLKTVNSRSPGNGIALLNTHRRLWLIYGKGYGIKICSKEGEGTRIVVRMPFTTMEAGDC